MKNNTINFKNTPWKSGTPDIPENAIETFWCAVRMPNADTIQYTPLKFYRDGVQFSDKWLVDAGTRFDGEVLGYMDLPKDFENPPTILTFYVHDEGDMSVGIFPFDGKITLTADPEIIPDPNDDPEYFSDFVGAVESSIAEVVGAKVSIYPFYPTD